ncbi:unnamed protein product [Musa textilis]
MHYNSKILTFLVVFSTTTASNYDYFNLVLQWLGSYCNVNCYCRMSMGYSERNFTIYSLWPAFSNRTFPSCDKNHPLPSASSYN